MSQQILNPVELYRRIWQEVAESHYDRDKLHDWQIWEHRFDETLKSEDDVLHFGNIALAWLGDRYNVLYRAEDKIQQVENPGVSAICLPGSIGYIRIASFADEQNLLCEAIEDMLGQISCCRAFIVDVRGNRGGGVYTANDATAMFLDRGKGGSFHKRLPARGHQHRATELVSSGWLETYKEDGQVLWRGRFSRRYNLTCNKPIAVLVDSKTGSATELFVSVLQENSNRRIVVIGSPTAGKGIAQVTRRIGNLRLQLTMMRFYSPAGTFFGDAGQTVKDGIKPDISVPTSEPLSNNDQQMDVALEWISKRLRLPEDSLAPLFA